MSAQPNPVFAAPCLTVRYLLLVSAAVALAAVSVTAGAQSAGEKTVAGPLGGFFAARQGQYKVLDWWPEQVGPPGHKTTVWRYKTIHTPTRAAVTFSSDGGGALLDEVELRALSGNGVTSKIHPRLRERLQDENGDGQIVTVYLVLPAETRAAVEAVWPDEHNGPESPIR